MCLLNTLIIFLYHPIAIIIVILIQVTVASIMLFVRTPTPWTAIILFLIYIGGLIILFVYITRMTPNKKFSPLSNIIIPSSVILTLSWITAMGVSAIINPIFNQTIFFNSLNKIFSDSSLVAIVAVILYLFFVILVVTALVESNETVLRPSKINYDKYS